MVDLTLVKKLREATGCGVSDCSQALATNNQNYDEAVSWLRKKGLSTAVKKSGRIATEGLIGIYNDGKIASIIEVNSETDFVAKNEKFQELVLDTLKASIRVNNSSNYVEDVKKQNINGRKIEDEFADKITAMGENLQLRRGKTISLQGKGVIVSYVHNKIADNLGKIGVLVALRSEAEEEILRDLGKQLAMHIAASKPEFFDESEVPEERLAREKEIFIERSKNSGKPQNIVEKMATSMVKKFYEENCLMNQIFVMDSSIKIADLIDKFSKVNKVSVEIQDYVFFVLGDGLEKNKTIS
ncbi:MAG: translation elongation factor Ts [Rickettsiales bacterium]|jgi:elongation factor Ts|nr:translation elongation factor Ts [Rickettsiales bacterium]